MRKTALSSVDLGSLIDVKAKLRRASQLAVRWDLEPWREKGLIERPTSVSTVLLPRCVKALHLVIRYVMRKQQRAWRHAANQDHYVSCVALLEPDIGRQGLQTQTHAYMFIGISASYIMYMTCRVWGLWSPRGDHNRSL